MPDFLFVYGTLHPDRAPAAILPTVRRLQSLGPATVRGTLYHLGDYPGLLIPGPVQLPTDTGALASLDAYEDFRPADPVGSLFVRIRTPATLPGGDHQTCWVYVYNQYIPNDIQPERERSRDYD
jgi:gamma-glutamylcyclotransferase (GGCT)/AIG2-like uncharacterized protein YtfP